jgi:hypothetical protein
LVIHYENSHVKPQKIYIQIKRGGGINPTHPKKEGEREKFRRGLYRIENNFTNYGM